MANSRFGVAGAYGNDLAVLGLDPGALQYTWQVLTEGSRVQLIAQVAGASYSDALPPNPTAPYWGERVFVDEGATRAWVAGHPGCAYIIGNEPDAPTIQMGGVAPEVYAELVLRAGSKLRSWDPSARIHLAAVMGNPAELAYLQRVLSQTGVTTMVAGCTVHAYGNSLLPAPTPADCMPSFTAMIDGYEYLMRQEGMIEREHWLTECCMVVPTTYQGQAEWMRLAVGYLAGKPWINRLAWFLSRNPPPEILAAIGLPIPDWHTDLIDADGNPTPLASTYAELASEGDQGGVFIVAAGVALGLLLLRGRLRIGRRS